MKTCHTQIIFCKYQLIKNSHSLTVVSYEIFKIFNLNKFNNKAKNLNIASKKNIGILLNHLKSLLEKKNFFVPEEKKHSMMMNINNLFYRLEASDKELRVLASIISTLAKNKNKA
jgi:tRNA C32,U32 (ribose-2'-O)-methylase TrmJ